MSDNDYRHHTDEAKGHDAMNARLIRRALLAILCEDRPAMRESEARGLVAHLTALLGDDVDLNTRGLGRIIGPAITRGCQE